MDRNDGRSKLRDEILRNEMNFTDFEIIIKEALNKQSYKQPYVNREKDLDDQNEVIKPNITDKELSMAINIDLKLFTQRFFEFVH